MPASISSQDWRSNQPQRGQEAGVASESGAVSETGSTCATALRQQHNNNSTYVRIKSWLTPLAGLHPYTPQSARLRATTWGASQAPVLPVTRQGVRRRASRRSLRCSLGLGVGGGSGWIWMPRPARAMREIQMRWGAGTWRCLSQFAKAVIWVAVTKRGGSGSAGALAPAAGSERDAPAALAAESARRAPDATIRHRAPRSDHRFGLRQNRCTASKRRPLNPAALTRPPA